MVARIYRATKRHTCEGLIRTHFRKGITTVLEGQTKKENRTFDYPFVVMCCSLLLLATSVEHTHTHLQPKSVKAS